MTGRVGNYKPAKGVCHAARSAAWQCLAATVILTVSIVTLLPGIALAHAAFVRSEPALNSVLSEPPGTVTIWFTGPVDPGLSGITVLDSTGRRVNTEEATVLPGDPKALTLPLPSLPQGTYTVVWKNFAEDGDSLSGSFVFSVGVPLPADQAVPSPPQPMTQSPVEIVLRWLGLSSILAIVGFLVFELFIARPVLAVEDVSQNSQRIGKQLESRVLSFMWLAAGLFLVASVGELVVTASVSSDIPLSQALGSPIGSVLQSGWGGVWLWRINFFLAMVVGLILASVGGRKNYHVEGLRVWYFVTLLFSAGTLFMLSMASHGAAVTEIRVAAIFSDYLHLLAASVWIGGIFYLALIIPPVMQSQRKQIDREQTSGQASPPVRPFYPASYVMAIRRFSTLAILSVGTLSITGLYSSWAQVTELRALSTPYGLMLLTKLGIVVPLLLFGAINLFYVRPRLGRNEKALQLLRKTIIAEAILATLVLLSVGILVDMEPARQTASSQETGQADYVVLQRTIDGVTVKAAIEPGTLGPNLVTVFLMDQSGRPITNAEVVTLKLTYLDGDIVSSDKSIADQGSGVWVARQTVFNVAGNWQGSLVIQRLGAFDTRASFQFLIPIAANTPAVVPSAETGKLLWV